MAVGTQTVIPASGTHPHRGKGSPRITCRFNAIDPVSPLGSPGADVGNPHDLPAGVQVWRTCYDESGRRVDGPDLVTTRDAGPGRAAITAQLVELALANLDIDLPETHVSPPTRTLPHIDTWFWTDAQPARSASASAGGVTITVTATLSSTVFGFDDGHTLTCVGPPTAYAAERPERDQHTDCSHRFEAPTRDLTIGTTSTWHLAWTATNGQTGDLGDIERTTSTPYRVQAKVTAIRTP